MPTPLADGAIVQISVIYSQNSQTLINTLHYKYSNAGGAPDYRDAMNELLNELQTAGDLEDDIAAAMHNTCTLIRWEAQPVYPSRFSKVTRTMNRAGARGGTALPQNVSAVITKQTDLATRYGRGTWHAVGLVTTDNDNGKVSFGLNGVLDQIGQDIAFDRALATLGTMVPVIWVRGVPARATPITSYKVEDTLRIMRRRTVGVGK